MKAMISTAIAAALVLSLPACKQGEKSDAPAAEAAAASLEALNGNWVVDLASLKFEGKPDEFMLKDGTYTCSTCIPPLTVAADGAMHPVADRPYFDNMSVKAVDDRTVEIHRQKAGKEVGSLILTVSADGNSLTNKFHDATVTPAIDGSGTMVRAGPAPAGAHAISGQWRQEKLGEYPEEARNISFKIDGNTVTSTSQGTTYVAELGGPAVALQGDTGGTMVAVAREGANGLKETYTRGGKEVGVTITTLNADGKSFNLRSTDPRDGTSTSLTANKAS